MEDAARTEGVHLTEFIRDVAIERAREVLDDSRPENAEPERMEAP